MSRVLIVSGDSHVGAPMSMIRPYLESRYHDLIDEFEREADDRAALLYVFANPSYETLAVIDHDGAFRSGGVLGVWDVDRRLREMDREGIAAELLIEAHQLAVSPFFAQDSPHPYPPDVRAAGARAHHRWLADCMAKADGRLFAVADPGPCLDMDETVKELRWVADHGFRSVSVPGKVTDTALPPLHDPHFEPFWKACAELGLVLSVHAGHGMAQGVMTDFFKKVASKTQGKSQEECLAAVTDIGRDSGTPFELNWIPLEVAWQMMTHGIFDRNPGLRLALTEVRADWVPAALAYLDKRFDHGDVALTKKPSEHWHERCWVGVSSIKRSEVRLRHEIGIDRMMFGRDYPHPEGTWPNTLDWIRDSLGDLPEDEVRLILGENAIECYGLERDKLVEIADRIGPEMGQLLGHGNETDPRILQNFERGGYTKESEVTESELDEVFRAGLPPVGASR